MDKEGLRYFRNIHRIGGVKARTELGEMVQEFEGRDVFVKRVRVLEILVPCFVNDGHDKVLAGIIGRLVELTVIYSCLVFSLCSMDFCSCGVLVDCVIL